MDKSAKRGRDKAVGNIQIQRKFSSLHFKISVVKRDKAIDTIKELPKEFELEALLEKLIFIEKVEQGLTQLKKGKTISHERVKDLIKKW